MVSPGQLLLTRVFFPEPASITIPYTFERNPRDSAVHGGLGDYTVVLAVPIRCNQRKCDTTPAQQDSCSLYFTPYSRQVSCTSFEMAG